MAGSNSYGFVGVSYPTQDTENSGVLTPQEILQLRNEAQFQEVEFDVDFLVIGGGGGSNGSAYGVGGGGAGGYLNSYASEVSGRNSANLDAETVKTGQVYTVEVGAGGALNLAGGDSTFASRVAFGGGAGSNRYGGGAGGCGGGGGRSGAGGSGTINQGNDGGGGFDSGTGGGPFAGGGGGGTLGPGQTSPGGNGGNGGNGTSSSITGTAVTRGGGGGGFSGDGSGTSGYGQGGGGLGGGGNAGNNNANSGAINTGSGGGASYDAGNAGTGGSGIVILRFPNTYQILTTTGTLVSSTSSDASDTIVQFTEGTGTSVFDEV